MKRNLLPIITLFLLNLCFAETTAQNPLAEYYGNHQGYPAWTDEINWGNRIDMSLYSQGANDFEKFEAARDELNKSGGGVLYYPAGTYDFSDIPGGNNGRGLMLKKGVVILGEKPAGDQDASDGEIELPTKFIFKFLKKGDEGSKGEVPAHWNLIGLQTNFGEELKEVDRVGILWVHLEGAIVYFGPQMTWGDRYESAGAFRSKGVMGDWKFRRPDGKFPLDPFCGSPMNEGIYEGAGNGRIVFGCKIQDAALFNDFIDDGFGEGGFFPYKFVARIGVYGSNVFIANNALVKPTRCFLYSQLTSEGVKDIIFDYGFNNGIDVNKSNLNINANKWSPEGGYWEPGVIIRDNYIYNHGFKGLEVSGNYMTIRGNTNDRDYLNPGSGIYGLSTNWTLTGNGYKTHIDHGSSDAFQSRAFDLAGKNLWVEDNQYWKTGTPSPSNDGEGILAQKHGGTDVFSWAITHNKGSDCQGTAEGYMMSWNVHQYGHLIAWNHSPSDVGSVNVGSKDIIDAAYVDNIYDGVIKIGEATIKDVITLCPEEVPAAPGNVTIQPDPEAKCMIIHWEDNSENEIGFRIDRRVSGAETWETIAYRPRKSVGSTENPQTWRDYLASSWIPYEYRVIALDCDQNEAGASEITQALTLTTIVATPKFNLPGGTYTEPIEVEISCNTPEADVRYTLDGSEPILSSELYSVPLRLTDSLQLKAKAFLQGARESYTATAEYLVSWTSHLDPSLASKIKLYPNPAKEFLQIDFVGEQRWEIEISSPDGRLFSSRQVSGPNCVLDISDFPPGTYIVSLRSRDYHETRRFMKY